MAMDIAAMRQVGEAILVEPRRFNMKAYWIESINIDDEVTIKESLYHNKNAIPPCGTVMCFAGEWYNLVTGEVDYDDIGTHCVNTLKLPNDKLLYETSWPGRFRTHLRAGTCRYAEHFVKVVLEDYIATNGWEND